MRRDGNGLRALLKDSYLNLIGKAMAANVDGALYGFSPLVGADYFSENFRLLVCGRAVDGWRKKWKADDPVSVQDIVESNIFFLPEADRSCEMNWLNRAKKSWDNKEKDSKGDRKGYNYHRSSFWSATRDLVQLMNHQSPNVKQDWAGTIAWSNVYKLSPGRGNPDHRLRQLQLEDCSHILQAEIAYLQPTHIAFITGSWGKKIIQNLAITPCPEENEFNTLSIVRHKGTLGAAKVVIASRPEGKKRSSWVNEVAQAFGSLGKP